MCPDKNSDKKDRSSDIKNRTDSIKEAEIGFGPEISAEIIDDIKKIPKDTAGLIVLKGPIIGEKFFIKEETTRIGRNSDSDIFLDDITVSRNHAIIEYRDGAHYLKDSGSLNGSYLNNELIDISVLKDKDRIQIGKYIFLFFHIK